MMEREDLIRHLDENSRVLLNQRIKDAFTEIDRADFLEPDYIPEAYEDYSLPIGYDQQSGQPTTTAFMLELLDPTEGHQVLEIGSGSGWMTALLAHIVGEEGFVWATEAVPELVTRTKANLQKYPFKNVAVEEAAKQELGKRQDFAYDRIIVNGSVPEIPEELIEQLADGGIMVIPVGDELVQVTKNNETVETKSFPGFVFPELI